MEIVSLDDFLGDWDMGSREYTAKQGFKAYECVMNGNYSSFTEVAERFGPNRRTISDWVHKLAAPNYVHQVEALQNLDLLPLRTDSRLFPYFKELWLHTLLSGSVYCNIGKNYYDASLSNNRANLIHIKSVLDREFGLACSVRLYKNNKGFTLGIQTDNCKNHLGAALGRLLVKTGIPLGDKIDYTVCIPDFIDANSFIYYACKLKPRKHYDSGTILSGFNLWLTNELTANNNADYVLNFLKKAPFNFNKHFCYDYDNISKLFTGNKSVQIIIDKSQVPFLELFLKAYKSLFSV